MAEDNFQDRKRSLLTRENIREGLRNPHKIFLSIYNRTRLSLLRWYYEKQQGSYLDYYLRATKSNVNEDPRGSVGPAELFEEVGEWQFQLLKNAGLEPTDYLLDLGCGVLRGGVHFIEYLENEHYYGMDISVDTLAKGREFLRKEGLEDREPVLFQNQDLRFEDDPLQEQSFDFILAQSVFTHLPRAQIKECLENLYKVLSEDGLFYATFNKSDTENYKKRRGIDYFHTLEFYSDLASEAGVDISEVSTNHPNGLCLLKIQL